MTDNKNNGMKNVIALGAVSFFTDFSTEMILGILPLFIINNLGATRAILGAIEGSSNLADYGLRMISGSLSDILGKRKIFVLIGYSLSTISKPFFAIANTWVGAFAVRIGDRAGKGLRNTPRDALIADSIPESKTGKAFGIHRSIDQMGAIVGPLVAFALLQIVDIRGVFLFSLIPGTVAVIILIFVVREVSIKKKFHSSQFLSNIGIVIKNNKSFTLLLVISGIFSLAAFNFSFVLLRSADLGVTKNFIPLVYLVINVAHTVIGFPSGVLADKIGKEKVLVLSYVVFLIALIFMIFSVNSVHAFLIAAVYGVYVGISETVQRAVVPRYVPLDLRGTAFGLFNLVTGVSFFMSNYLFGFLWDTHGFLFAIFYSLIITTVAIFSLLIFIKKNKLPQTI